MRTRRREWKNGKYPKWTVRIIWYDDNASEKNELGGDIKLVMRDCERSQMSVFPKNLDAAEQIWEMFRQSAPKEKEAIPIITTIVELSNKFGLLKT